MLPTLRKEDLLKEITRCKFDFAYFARKYLKILDRNRKLSPFRRNDLQKRMRFEIENNRHVYNLKARKVGISTETMAEAFWLAHFNEGFKAATIAHEDGAVQEMFNIVLRYYDNLPNFLKQGPFALSKRRADMIQWKHGGNFRVASAESERFRSSDLDFIHFSEFAKYRNSADLIAATVGAARADCKIVYETTARGLGYGYDAWRADNGWKKLFFPWMLEKSYRLPEAEGPIQEDIVSYAAKYGLDSQQMWWASAKLRAYNNDLRLFHQEFPATAELAFVVSSGRVFQIAFPEAKVQQGIMSYAEPEPYHIYTMGVDVASGSPHGDYSAWCLLDVTDKERPKIVSTFYSRVDTVAFSEFILREARKYEALVVVERNTYGLDVIHRLEESGYSILYREIKHDKRGSKMVERIGFHTTGATRPVIIGKLKEFLGGMTPVMDIKDQRLQVEVNDFVYADDLKQREEAMPGAHDDLLIATGLALIGMNQVALVEQRRMHRRPKTKEEKRSYRRVTGKKYDPRDKFEDDTEEDEDYYQFLYGSPNRRAPLRSVSEFLRNRF